MCYTQSRNATSFTLKDKTIKKYQRKSKKFSQIKLNTTQTGIFRIFSVSVNSMHWKH